MRTLSPRWCLAALFASVLVLARSVAQTPLPVGGEPLLPADGLAAFEPQVAAALQDAARVERTAVEDAPGFGQAWHLETTRDAAQQTDVQLRAVLSRAVRQGDVALLRFHVRALHAADETGQGRVFVNVRNVTGERASSLLQWLSIGPQWQEFVFPFTFNRDYAAGEVALDFNAGFKRQSLQLGGVALIHYGTTVPEASLPRTRFTYAGREPDAPWRQAALARIERIRKSNFTLRVRDGEGRPVTGARLHVAQRQAEFRWGTALQMRRLVEDTADNRRYREKVLELFDEASTENDLKWPVWTGDRFGGGGYSQEQTLAGLRWLREHDFLIRGHVLVWPSWRNLPRAIRALHDAGRTAEIPAAVRAHVRDITAATAGLIDEWDVLNEPYDNHDLIDLFGRDIMIDWFKAARAALPAEVRLYLNDYGNHDQVLDREHVQHFEQTAQFLLERGAPLEGLGVQAHFGSVPNDPERILATFDRYHALARPLRITEFDIDTDDEELQADFTRDFLILCFSHPAVVGVQLWGFWEGAHWRPRAAMYRTDWSEKPNLAVYKSLVLDQWRTRLDGVTDANGDYVGRGFFGDYVVRVEIDGGTHEHPFRMRAGAFPPVVDIVLP